MLPGLALDSWAQVILPHSWDCRLVSSYPALPQRLFSMPLYLLVLPCSLSQLSFLWALAAVYNLLVWKDKINNECSSKILAELGAVMHTPTVPEKWKAKARASLSPGIQDQPGQHRGGQKIEGGNIPHHLTWPSFAVTEWRCSECSDVLERGGWQRRPRESRNKSTKVN